MSANLNTEKRRLDARNFATGMLYTAQYVKSYAETDADRQLAVDLEAFANRLKERATEQGPDGLRELLQLDGF